ncbi:MAG: Crp/Fnr family transcriptional regulator [Gammaproteobacteria bacterium]|nr:Crp/Fnr family transcriptional regulator [Gammaproteobacteria bacterium]
MPTPLVLKLARVLDLGAADVAALAALGSPSRRCAAGRSLVEAGRRMSAAILVHEGWAVRHRTLADGRRLVLDFVLPGDICDPAVFVTSRADFSMQALTDLRYGLVQSEDVLDLVNRSPRIGAAFWWAEAHEEAITRAHLVAIGRMSAYERVAYLLWELWTRLRVVNLADADGFEAPFGQDVLADAAGLSYVHLSRTLCRLDRDGLIHRRPPHGWRIPDAARLREAMQISDALHLTPLPRRIQQRLSR